MSQGGLKLDTSVWLRSKGMDKQTQTGGEMRDSATAVKARSPACNRKVFLAFSPQHWVS